MRNNIIILVAVVVVCFGAYFALAQYVFNKSEAPSNGQLNDSTIVQTFTADSGEEIEVTFDIENSTATLDGRGHQNLVFTQTEAASGVRYENTDTNLVLWNKGNEVTLYEADEAVFTGVTELVVPPPGDSEENTSTNDLTNSSWVWVNSDVAGEGEVTAPAGEFVLSFDGEGNMSSETDCNTMGGIYSQDGEVLSMGQFVMTKMYCEGSMEMVYADQLALVNSHVIEGDELRLIMARDYGVMVFKRK